MRALARNRLLHYLAIGAALFAADRTLRRPATDASGPIVITAERVRALIDDYRRASGLAPGDADVATLVRRAVDEELLYREALARGLDRDDRSIRWQLVEKMSFLEDADEYTGDREALYRRGRSLGLDRDDPVIRRMLIEKLRLVLKDAATSTPVTDDDVRGWIARHPDDFRTPARVSFWHVFLSHAGVGGARDAEARALVARLRAEHTSPAVAVTRGDPFVVAPYLRALSADQLTTMFGAEFAAAVARAAPHEWTGPIASAHGLHVVWVEAFEPASDPPLDAVRGRVAAALARERADARLRELLARLRRTHIVRVEWPDGAGS